MPEFDSIKQHGPQGERYHRPAKRGEKSEREIDLDDPAAIIENPAGGVAKEEAPETVQPVKAKGKADEIVEAIVASTSREEGLVEIMKEAYRSGFVVEKNGSLYPADGFEEEGARIILALRANEKLKEEPEKVQEPKEKHVAKRDGKELKVFKDGIRAQLKRIKDGDVEDAKLLLDELVATGFIRETKDGYVATKRDANYSKQILDRFNRISEQQAAAASPDTSIESDDDSIEEKVTPTAKPRKKEKAEDPAETVDTEPKAKSADQVRLEAKRTAAEETRVPVAEIERRFNARIEAINAEIEALNRAIDGKPAGEVEEVTGKMAELIVEEGKLKRQRENYLSEHSEGLAVTELDLATEETLQGLKGSGRKTDEYQLLSDIFGDKDLNQLIGDAYEFIDDDFRSILAAAMQPAESGRVGIEIVDGKFVAKSREGAKFVRTLETILIDHVLEKAFSSVTESNITAEVRYRKICEPDGKLIDRIRLSNDPEILGKLKTALLEGQLELRADGSIEPLNDLGSEILQDIVIETQRLATEKFTKEAYEVALRGFREKDGLHYQCRRYIAFEKENERIFNAEFSSEEFKAKKRLIGRGPELQAYKKKEKYFAEAEVRRIKLEATLANYEEEMFAALKEEAVLRANLLKASAESRVDNVDVESYISMFEDADMLTRFQRQNFKQVDRAREALAEIINEAEGLEKSKRFQAELDEIGLGVRKLRGLGIDEKPLPTLAELYEETSESDRKKIIEQIERELFADIEANLDGELSEEDRKTLLESNYFLDYVSTMLYEKGAIDRLQSECDLENKLLDLKTIRVLLMDVKKSETERDQRFEKIIKEAVILTGKRQAESEVRRLVSRLGVPDGFDINSDEVYSRIFTDAAALFERTESTTTERRSNATKERPDVEIEEIDKEIAGLSLASNDAWRGYSSATEGQSAARKKKKRGAGILGLFGTLLSILGGLYG